MARTPPPPQHCQRPFRCFLVILIFLFLITILELRQSPAKLISTRSAGFQAAPADTTTTTTTTLSSLSSSSPLSLKLDLAESSSSQDDATAASDTTGVGGTGGGVIILNLLGRLANNLIQASFANHLVQELNDVALSKEQGKKQDTYLWKVVYRPLWEGVFPDQPRARFCFPHAMMMMLPQPPPAAPPSARQQHQSTTTISWDDLPQSLKRNKVFTNLTTKSFWNSMHRRENSLAYTNWRSALEQQQQQQGNGNKIISMTLQHSKFSFVESKQFTRDLVQALSSSSSSNNNNTIRLLHLEAFFIHYDWMHDILPQMNHWTYINPTCCWTVVPDNVIVLHYRDFEDENKQHVSAQLDMVPIFYDILEHYNYLPHQQQQQQEQEQQHRPIWIVCQLTSLQHVGLRRLVRAIESNIRVPNNESSSTLRSVLFGKINNASSSSMIQVVTGRDEMDAMCILRQAQVLLLTPGSTFSQFPAIFPRAVAVHQHDDNHHGSLTTTTTTTTTTTRTRQIHYPLLRLFQSPVTLKVPHWHYHLVNQTTTTTTTSATGVGGIQQFNVPHEQIQVKDD